MIVWYSAPPASAPEPRLTARSMLSLGTELFFAFWMASKSVGLPAGSPPPIRAATSTFLISFANILPRRASMTAFLCLVVAHFEWPDMRSFSVSVVEDQVDEDLVDAGVAAPLRMERRRHQRSLPDRDDPTHRRAVLHPREDVDSGAGLLDPGGADEDRVDGSLHALELQVALEGVDLTSEGVA